MNQNKIQSILSVYQKTKIKDSKTPVLLSGYRSFSKSNVKYRASTNIMYIINNRAYHVRTSKLMANVIEKAKQNPSLLKK